MWHFIKNLFQLAIGPQHGWEDIAIDDQDPERLTADGLYPLLGVVAISAFFQIFYHHELGIVYPLERAIIIFSVYFATLLFAQNVVPSALDKCVDGGEVDLQRASTFIIYSLGLMALVSMVENLVPLELSLVQFLPVLVALVMWKATRYLHIMPTQNGRFIFAAIVFVLLPPILLNMLLSMILPQSL